MLKKIVTKNAEYWGEDTNFEAGSPNRVEKPKGNFHFHDFVNAFRILSRLGYKDVNLKDSAKFTLLTQYLTKSFNNYSIKNHTATSA